MPTAADAATDGVPVVSMVTPLADDGVKVMKPRLKPSPAFTSSVSFMISRNLFFTKAGKSYFAQSSYTLVHVTASPNSEITKDVPLIPTAVSGIRMFSCKTPFEAGSGGPVIVNRFTVSPFFFSKLASYNVSDRKLFRKGPVGVSWVHVCISRLLAYAAAASADDSS